jgi:ParB-like chromosome segregation protein Spo0J
MDAEMFAKATASIHQFGFVDPVTVREVGLHDYQIIDGSWTRTSRSS